MNRIYLVCQYKGLERTISSEFGIVNNTGSFHWYKNAIRKQSIEKFSSFVRNERFDPVIFFEGRSETRGHIRIEYE